MTGFRLALLAYTGALWLPGLFLFWRAPRCRAPRGADAGGRLSVIVPARDEERRIRPLLESLAIQRRPADEVLVVDDGSRDGTAALARSLGARVITAPAKPEGWTGKSWACWTGAAAAQGEVLVFVDADARLEVEGLARVASALAERGGVVSVQPYHAVRRPYERLSAFCNVAAMASLGAFTPLGSRLRAAGAFGPCLAISRADYYRFGGHQAVRESVVEDMEIGEEARAAGLPVARFAGRGTVSFRMYPEGFRRMVDGWSKGLGLGARSSPPLARALMTAWITGATTSALLFALGAAVACSGGRTEVDFFAATAGLYALYAGQLWWMLRRIGSFGLRTALAFPAPLAFFHAVFFRSAWMTTVRGRVVWRGREIEVSRPAQPRERRKARGRKQPP